MKLRYLGMSVLLAGLSVSAVVGLRAADDKPKTKAKETKQAQPVEEKLEPGIIKFTSAPAAVQKTFKEEVKGGKIELLGKGESDKGVFYKALIGSAAGHNYEVAVGENGLLLEKILQMVTTDVTPEDCPAPVMKTLGEEAKGAKIESVEKVVEGKRAHFVMNVVHQKSKYQVIIMEDGTLISKVVDDEKDADVVPAPVEAKATGKETGTRKK
ncbi:MAG: hypothetical protein WCH39_16525 [Schlesneria sp.]